MSIPIRHLTCLHRMMAMVTMAVVTLGLHAQTRVEYFFDTDPGIGLATETSTSPDMGGNINFTVSTTGLETGLHLFGVRVMKLDHWSPTVTQLIVVPRSGSEANIHYMEYFWDTDPGFGEGTPIDITSGTEISFNDNKVSTDRLSTGLHLFGIRAMADNQWSPTLTQMVYIPTSGDIAVINRVEYFWDTDPGYGNATSIDITPGTEVNISDLRISTEGLGEGEHFLGIRAMADGHWSPTLFYVKGTGSQAMNTNDLNALKKLHTDLGGENWNGDNWNLLSDLIEEGNWSGVTFNEDGRVTAIDLENRGLSGELSSLTAINLPLLTSLNLKRNALTGDPAPFLTQATQLALLDLSYNQLDNLSAGLSLNITSLELSNQHRTYRNDYNYPGLESIVTKPVINVGSTMTSLALPPIWGYNHKSQQLNNHPDLYADKTTNRNIVGTLIWDESKGGYVFSGYTKHVDVDDATELVLDVNYSSDLRYSAYPAIIHFTSGDADMSGVVDVTDVQRTLIYVLNTEEYATPPISLWAANTYTTGETSRMINIQDIVCTVNIVLDNQSQSARAYMTRSATEQQDMRNYFYADGHDMMLNAQDEIGAFDLELQGVTPQQVRLALNANDWQMVTRQTAGGGTRLIVLSPTGAKLPTGITKLLSLDEDGMPIAVTATSPNAIELKAGVLGTSPTGIDEIKQHSDLRVTADHGQIILSTSMAGGQTTVSVYGAQGILLSKHHLKSLPAGQTKLPLSSEENLLIVKVQSAETGTKIFKLQTTK